MTDTTIAILIPYFGKWPEWKDLFFETLRRNKTVDFHFLTDCDVSVITADNIHFHSMSFDAYVAHANRVFAMEFNIPNPYKICDLRPLFGEIHYEIIKDYQFYGWTDMDLLFGDIRSFYTEALLARYDVFSTHVSRISGHLALFRNTERNRKMYLKIYRWREALQNPDFVGIDEHGITNAYFETIIDKVRDKFRIKFNGPVNAWLRRRRKRKLYMVEQYSTPFVSIPWTDGSVNSSQPDTWYYIDGNITNDRDARNFMYIHFMNFKSSTWRHDGTTAPWEKNEKICNAGAEDMAKGIVINTKGINPIDL